MESFKLLSEDSKFDSVILAAGDFPHCKTTLEILKRTSPLIVCDSALEEVVRFNNGKDANETLKPSAVVGDGDSLLSTLKEQYKAIWHQVTEQDDNDLTKATKFTIEHYHPKSIAYIGATGKREDHTIGNIALMTYYFREFGIRPILITDYGWFTTTKGESKFGSFAGQQVSIYNVNCTHLEGLDFKWNPYPYSELWQGTLNEATGESFTLKGDGIYMTFQTFKKKLFAK